MCLAAAFPARPVLVSQDDGPTFHLEADSIDDLDGSGVQEHLDAAVIVLDRMNGWVMSGDPLQQRVYLSGDVVTPAGDVHHVANAGFGQVRARGANPASPAATLGTRIVAAAAVSQPIDDLLTLFATHPPDFHTLYKVYEIIKHEAGPALWRWTTASEAERFTLAANSRAVSGLDARHGVAGSKTPKKIPMSLDESQRYVRRLAHEFLRSVV